MEDALILETTFLIDLERELARGGLLRRSLITPPPVVSARPPSKPPFFA